MSFPLALGLAMRSRGGKKTIAIAAALVFVFTLMRTGSRGGTIAFVAAMLVFVAGFPARRRMVMIVALVFAVPLAWTLGPPEYRERMKTMLSLEQDYNQTDYVGRKAVRERAALYYKENLITGVGMFCFPIAEGQHNKEIGRTGKWSAPHNAYWQALAELGTPGGVFLFGMLVTAIMSGLRCWKWRLPDGSSSAFHRPEYLAAIVGFGTGAYFLSHAYFWPMFGFVALSGLAGLVSRTGAANGAEATVPGPRRRSAALGATGPSAVTA
jgi:O-antigen ligase